MLTAHVNGSLATRSWNDAGTIWRVLPLATSPPRQHCARQGQLLANQPVGIYLMAIGAPLPRLPRLPADPVRMVKGSPVNPQRTQRSPYAEGLSALKAFARPLEPASGQLTPHGGDPHSYQGKETARQWSPEDDSAITIAPERTSRWELGDAQAGALSGGQGQRAWIAVVPARQTQLLPLDEPDDVPVHRPE